MENIGLFLGAAIPTGLLFFALLVIVVNFFWRPNEQDNSTTNRRGVLPAFNSSARFDQPANIVRSWGGTTQNERQLIEEYNRHMAEAASSRHYVGANDNTRRAEGALDELSRLNPSLARQVESGGAEVKARAVKDQQKREQGFAASLPGKALDLVDECFFTCHCKCHSDPSYTSCGGYCCGHDA